MIELDRDIFATKLREIGEQKKAELIQVYDALGLRSSGEWADSLQVVVEVDQYVTSLRIVGAAYTVQLAVGRQPGQFPNIQKIAEWVEYEGNTPEDMTDDQWVFLVARKIARDGTEIYQKGGTDLIERTITEEWKKMVIGLQKEIFHHQTVTHLRDRLKRMSINAA